MLRQDAGDIAKQVRPLGEDMIAVAVGEAVLVRRGRVDDLLETENVGPLCVGASGRSEDAICSW
jgi:hypothetical protein